MRNLTENIFTVFGRFEYASESKRARAVEGGRDAERAIRYSLINIPTKN